MRLFPEFVTINRSISSNALSRHTVLPRGTGAGTRGDGLGVTNSCITVEYTRFYVFHVTTNAPAA